MKTNELLAAYYDGFSKKQGWEHTIHNDFIFMGAGGDASKQNPVHGKNGYIQVIKRFSVAFEKVTVKEMITEGEHAFVTAAYDLVSTTGKKMVFDIGELWKVKDGLLYSLEIYFDTETYNAFMKS